MFGDNGALGFQLEVYRWEDHFRRMRDDRRARIEENHSTTIVARYNDLVVRFNNLLDASQQTARQADRLRDELAARDQEIADLKRRMANAEAQSADACDSLARSSAYYRERALAAEDQLKALRSRQP